MRIRLAKDEDYAAIARLHRQTIRNVNCKDYSEDQIYAWSVRTNAGRFRNSATKGKRWVAIEDGKIVIKYEPGDSVVCNLASINIAKVNTDEEIKKVIPVAMKVLDNVIELNFYPIKEAENTAKKYRSV